MLTKSKPNSYPRVFFGRCVPAPLVRLVRFRDAPTALPSALEVAYAQGMDWLIVVLIAVVGIIFLVWAARAGRTRATGISDADRYQLELAKKAQEHTKAQARRAAELRPVNPSQRTGYSQSNAYRSGPAVGQNVTHGQNLNGYGSGQNAGKFSGPGSQQVPRLNPALALQLQGMVRGGQTVQAINLLRNQTGLGLAEARNVIERMRP